MNNPMLSAERNAQIQAIADQVMMLAQCNPALPAAHVPFIRSLVELAATTALAQTLAGKIGISALQSAVADQQGKEPHVQ